MLAEVWLEGLRFKLHTYYLGRNEEGENKQMNLAEHRYYYERTLLAVEDAIAAVSGLSIVFNSHNGKLSDDIHLNIARIIEALDNLPTEPNQPQQYKQAAFHLEYIVLLFDEFEHWQEPQNHRNNLTVIIEYLTKLRKKMALKYDNWANKDHGGFPTGYFVIARRKKYFRKATNDLDANVAIPRRY